MQMLQDVVFYVDGGCLNGVDDVCDAGEVDVGDVKDVEMLFR